MTEIYILAAVGLFVMGSVCLVASVVLLAVKWVIFEDDTTEKIWEEG